MKKLETNDGHPLCVIEGFVKLAEDTVGTEDIVGTGEDIFVMLHNLVVDSSGLINLTNSEAVFLIS